MQAGQHRRWQRFRVSVQCEYPAIRCARLHLDCCLFDSAAQLRSLSTMRCTLPKRSLQVHHHAGFRVHSGADYFSRTFRIPASIGKAEASVDVHRAGAVSGRFSGD